MGAFEPAGFPPASTRGFGSALGADQRTTGRRKSQKPAGRKPRVYGIGPVPSQHLELLEELEDLSRTMVQADYTLAMSLEDFRASVPRGHNPMGGPSQTTDVSMC